MTEPPRPPGGDPNDPTTPVNPYPANDPVPGSTPPPPAPSAYHPGGYPPAPGGGSPWGTPGPPPPGGGSPWGTPPPYGQPGPGAATEDRTWILVAHLGGAAGMFFGAGTLGWIAPLVAMLGRGTQSPVVRAEAVQALNFQLTWSIIAVVCWSLSCLVFGAFLAPIAALIGIVFGVIAGVKASNGEPYTYPMSYPFIK